MSRVTAALLLHVNLLLVLYSGAGLASAARLRWDPSTYVLCRALFPAETRAASVALVVGPLLLLAAAHLPLGALVALTAAPRVARWFLAVYAACMVGAVCAEAACGAWMARRVTAWLHSTDAEHLREVMGALTHLQPLLKALSEYSAVPTHLDAVLQEAEHDAPLNLRVVYAAAAALLLLQAAAALLAALLAIHTHHTGSIARSSRDAAGDEKAPLRTAFKEGRLVAL